MSISLQNYTQILLPFRESKRTEIIKSAYNPQANTNNQGLGAGSANGTSEERKSNQQNNQNKTQVYQKKPKLLVCNDYLAKREDSTLIKHYINHIIIQQLELFPSLGTQFRRTPYQYTKYNERMGAFMKALQDHIANAPKIFDELKENLFDENPSLKNINANTQEYILKHPIKKQIFSIGEIIDEVTDSSFQNIIQVLDYYNLRNLNPAVLSVCYANMRVLEKNGGTVNDVPKLSFIQLGLQKQELNKHLIFYNAFQNSQFNQKKDQLTNIQYISMYHQENTKSEDNQQSSDTSLKMEGNETLEPNSNCFEIAINEYLNKQDGSNAQLDDLFIKNEQKCPKIIGQSEFLYLFEQVLRLVRHHKPNYIIFSYDFSLTKSHNHYYNLKPDVLGYFSYMLSQISNNHVLFVANTKDENHLFPKQLEQLSSQQEVGVTQQKFEGLDSFDNTTNYLSISKVKDLSKIEEKDGVYQNSSEDAKDIDKTSSYNQNQKANLFDKSEVLVQNNNNIIQESQTDNITIPFKNQQKKKFVFYTSDSTQQTVTSINKLASWMKTEPSQTAYQKYLTYCYDKFYCNNFSQDEKRKYLVQKLLLINKNLYQNIQEQLNSIFFSLFETINYRKIILKQNLKTAIHVQVQFMSSITEQIRRSVMPRRSYSNQEQLKGVQKVKWTLQQIKIHDYMNKIKQIKHIIDFVSHSNGEKVNLLQKFSKQNKYTEVPKGEGIEEEIKANSESMIINVMQKYPQNSEMYAQTLVSELKRNEFDKLYSDQLKVKIMLKRYTQALLNNWVYDLRRKKKIYLHILNLQDRVDQELKFFYTEHSQYVIDYDYDSQNRDQSSSKIAIYFFNVQRGKHFKNYVLTEYRENQFIQEEIKYSVQKVLDVNWKSTQPLSSVSSQNTLHLITGKSQQGDTTRPIINLQNQLSSQDGVTDKFQVGNFIQNGQFEGYIHQESLLDLEIFNSSLCITDQFIVKMFGEVINPTTWKQKEFSKMIFIVPRKQISNYPDQNDQQLQLKLLEPYSQENFIFNSLPRSGCVCVYQKEDKIEKIYVFGGISYNGYLCNFIEEYAVDNRQQQLLFLKVNYKKLSQKTFRPLFSPFTFTYKQHVYFLGGEIDKNLILRGFNQVYLQQYSFKESQFKLVQTLKRKEIPSKLNLTNMDQKLHQKEFLKFAEIIPFQAVNLNAFYDENNQIQWFALLGKCNSAIEQILEKTTTIEIQLQNLVESLDPNKKLMIEKNIRIETTLEDETQQELRLNEYNSSKTFFLSSFQADQSSFLATQNKTNEQQKQPQANSQPAEGSNQHQNQPTNKNSQSTASNIKSDDQTKKDSLTKDIEQKTKINKNILAQQEDKTLIQKAHQKEKQQEKVQLEDSQKMLDESSSIKNKEDPINKLEQQDVQNVKDTKHKNFKDLVDKINFKSKGLQFESQINLAGCHENTGKASYLNPVQQEYYFIQDDKQIPKYFLVQNYFSKLINILTGDNTQNQFQIVQKFQLTIRFNDEDFKDSLLSNQMHFLTFHFNMDRKVCIFYKSLSLEEYTELSQSYPNFRFYNSVFKCQVRFDQNKLSMLNLQDEGIETINENLVNRYIICDQEYIYLINGTDYKDPNIPYNKLSPCERVNIKTKIAEKIDDCIYLDCKKSYILQNNSYIFYIGLYENQEDFGTEDEKIESEKEEQSEESEDEDDGQSEKLIVQIFDKKQKVWKVIRLSQCKEINNKFLNFTFLLGNQDNKLFAINTKFSIKKKETIANHELTFDLNRCSCIEEILHLPFNWKSQKSVDIIRSLYYSATAYAMLPTNPVTYSNISLIPKLYSKN
ncbi:hypothetical protein TTHERM_00196020 (macronuclear) [Tetrahymena thermophila SB210]|uniref:WIF domain-containing protein n=1 Tax=Tetrahymena thermophila (strain SB210) TaxID=312017 RepID=Q23K32_TETTS|nr:hypothetical protein TTHERM_00196020 [Tetrahymena thermophila SB210]EAR97011.2 hypothetical protein TTHERM_00196020 [Tetrahymena thermophila SB210]|eukprot:XP_001017256.2 hypothetical protein TTHERM_00196020 [Tetrahymena thermophila SB210]